MRAAAAAAAAAAGLTGGIQPRPAPAWKLKQSPKWDDPPRNIQTHAATTVTHRTPGSTGERDRTGAGCHANVGHTHTLTHSHTYTHVHTYAHTHTLTFSHNTSLARVVGVRSAPQLALPHR